MLTIQQIKDSNRIKVNDTPIENAPKPDGNWRN